MFLVTSPKERTSTTMSTWASARLRARVIIASSKSKRYLERQKVRANPSITLHSSPKKSRQAQCFMITKYAMPKILKSRMVLSQSVNLSLSLLMRLVKGLSSLRSEVLYFPQTAGLGDSDIRMSLYKAFASMEKKVSLSQELIWSMKRTMNWSETKMWISLT